MKQEKNPIILAIDAATEACSVALAIGEQTIYRYEVAPRQHTQKLLPMVQSLFAEAQIALSRVDAIACGQGPGSFTGVRIALSATQGLALGLDCPVIGISNLQILAQGALRCCGATKVLTAIDARMQELYFAAYHQQDGCWQALISEQVTLPEKLNNTLEDRQGWHAVGTGFQVYAPMLTPIFGTLPRCGEADLPHALDILPLAMHKWQQGDVVAPEDLEPTYLRNQVAWQKSP